MHVKLLIVTVPLLVILHQFFKFIGNFIFELNVNHLVLRDLESLTTQVHLSRGILMIVMVFFSKAKL